MTSGTSVNGIGRVRSRAHPPSNNRHLGTTTSSAIGNGNGGTGSVQGHRRRKKSQLWGPGTGWSTVWFWLFFVGGLLFLSTNVNVMLNTIFPKEEQNDTPPNDHTAMHSRKSKEELILNHPPPSRKQKDKPKLLQRLEESKNSQNNYKYKQLYKPDSKKPILPKLHQEQEHRIPFNTKTRRNIADITYAQRRQAAYRDDHDDNHHPELQYAPQRIPGYLPKSPRTLFGFVMRDFVTRVCSRKIAQSNILVVSQDAPTVAQLLLQKDNKNNPQQPQELQKHINYTVGGSALIHAHAQQHTIHGIYDGHDATISSAQEPSIETWWNNQDGRPSWFLLMMVDSYRSDEVLRQAHTLLQQSTVTYMVVSFGADPNFLPYGIDAIRMLLQQHSYKVQLLSISHVQHDVFYPNADITLAGLEKFESFLIHSARYEPVRGYVFATQGLDLAIPLASDTVQSVSKEQIVYKPCDPTYAGIQWDDKNHQNVTITCRNRTQPVAPTLTTDMNHHNQSSDQPLLLWHSHPNFNQSEAVCTRIQLCKPPRGVKRKSAGKYFAPPDIAAATIACTTRILPQTPKPAAVPKKTRRRPNLLLLMMDPISRAQFHRTLPQTSYLIQQKLNFTSFSSYTAVGNNSGPNQAALYSGVPLSAGNRESIADTERVWLWDRLKKSSAQYVTLKAEDGCIANSNMLQSINPQVDHGEQLNRMFCFDFQRPNCLGGKRAAEHLLEYTQQFITTYNTNNTDDDQPWAAFVHFIDSHEDSMMMAGTLDDLLWKFLMNLYSSPDEPSSVWDDTVIVLLSDHGLHYGNYLMTRQGLKERSQPMFHIHLPSKYTTQAQREVLHDNSKYYTTPFDVHETLLQLLLPEENAATKDSSPKLQGSSLLEELPSSGQTCETTPLIPEDACRLFRTTTTDRGALSLAERMVPSPASALSFYSDIPKQNKMSLEAPPIDAEALNTTQAFLRGTECMCATNRRQWKRCSEHPWSARSSGSRFRDKSLQRNWSLEETFAIVDCHNTTTSVQVQVHRNPSIVERPAVQRSQKSGMARRRPSIMFIEVDSVSSAYADRHLPKTRELLERFRIRKTIDGTTGRASFDCGSSKWCSADLQEFSPFGGPNSIPNQISTFGGCMVTTGPTEDCEKTSKTTVGGTSRTICYDDTHLAFGMEQTNQFRDSTTWCRVSDIEGSEQVGSSPKRSPWIFDIAERAGYVTLFAEEFCFDKSPWTAQNNIFPLKADILPHELFCRITERQITRKGGKVSGPLWRYVGATDPNVLGIDGEGSFPKANVSLSYLKSMWEVYPDIPKLAYLNALAAHVYAKYPVMTLAAEEYDANLASFVESMLESQDAKDTIFVVRSDHGMQGPPNNLDYSTQVEALRPWTEIIVPRSFANFSLESLHENQQRLVTGPDLYRTLTNLMVQNEPGIMPKPSEWMIDILNDEIPKSRTCADAKVSSDYCIYEDERTFAAPNFGTCNLAETHQDYLCPSHAEDFRYSLSANVRSRFISRKIEEDSFCHANNITDTTQRVSSSLQQKWSEIDKQVSKYPKSRVSGGIFLYPRQTALITSLVGLLADFKMKSAGKRLVLCETGFGAGHGSATFLAASPHVDLHIFDKFDRPYQLPVVELLKKRYPHQTITHYRGDSCKSVPENLVPVIRPGDLGETDVNCDVLHGSSLCRRDNIDLVEKSPCGVLLTTTAMNSLVDDVVYFGPNGQWTHLMKNGCITDVACFTEEDKKLDRTYVFNKGGATISHKFCFAITTGKCQKFQGQIGLQEQNCQRTLPQFTNRVLNLAHLCTSFQVPIPPLD
ncbi:Protein of unknown function (DUF229) [Seminavis robusta]|uniref:Uncharacterized protein n=1 Tax=Seminavis robusta TaxID=568900 RepID=A0A9N8HE41_9STRA|nr:Protein of unknown function (DUF229) [Seminavis robusta]|eukprot:Sro455_g146490.1 Protein of unknown function (DUF229) (1791) ;mRNA; r:19740-25283